MRLFKRKSAKAGYCNISEPVSDLDPKRISAIKAQAQHVDVSVESSNNNSPSAKSNGKGGVGAKSSGNDDTFITAETITLDTFPSAESSRNKAVVQKQPQQQVPEPPILSPNTVDARLLMDGSPDSSRPGTMFPVSSASASASESAVEETSPSKVEPTALMPKTPDTFFGGRNRKRIELKLDSTSHNSHNSHSLAPTEHPIGPMGIAAIPTPTKGRTRTKSKATAVTGNGGTTQKEDDNFNIIQSQAVASGTHGADEIRKQTQTQQPQEQSQSPKGIIIGSDDQSQTSDLDKSFSPQIVSVNSDITEPSYGLGLSSKSRKKKQLNAASWKKFRRLRRYFNETFQTSATSANNNDTACGGQLPKGNGGQKGQMSLLDMFIDAICSHPINKN